MEIFADTGAESVAPGSFASVTSNCSPPLSLAGSRAGCCRPTASMDGGEAIFVVSAFATVDFAPKLSLIFSPSVRLRSPSPCPPSPSPFDAASSLALRTCSLMRACSLSSSPLSCLSFFLIASCLLNASGELSIQATCMPLSFSSTLQIPSRPRCFANSVSDGHLVAFWNCQLQFVTSSRRYP